MLTNDRKPELCLRNDDIKKYAGKAVTAFQVGDELTLNITCRVKGVESAEHPDYNEPTLVEGKSKPRKMVLEKRLELEVIGGEADGEDEVDEYLRKKPGE